MMNKAIIISISLFVVAVGIYGFGKMRYEKEEVRNIYIGRCAACHGSNAEWFVGRSNVSKENKAYMAEKIKAGNPAVGMPAFKDLLTDKEIDDLIDFILDEVKKKASEPVVDDKSTTHSGKMNYTLETVVDNLDIPWGMTWLPNNDMLVTEREGTLLRISEGVTYEIKGMPEVVSGEQAGVFDIELHPEYKKNGWIYIAYAASDGKSRKLSNTYLLRTKITNDSLYNKDVIFKASPLTKSPYHFGGRIEFDNDGYLYLSVGDRYKRDFNPQALVSYAGKIHRMMDNGIEPASNPFYTVDGAVKSIWSYGHRNPQGMVFDSANNILYTHEHGPKGGDEVNIIQKGKNYGWPVITYGVNYSGTTITKDTAKMGMEQPIKYWVPSIAPCGMELVTGDKYPAWKGSLLVGSLKFNEVHRLEMQDGKVIHEEVICKDIGRVRNIKQGPDGYIYVAVEEPGKIIKIVPAE